ncbi:MAG: fumarylacetoacetase, partial [Nocardioidaceae bacterium]|nr:fumarylacetoacetase [Nocardioidaceae bacterium]
IFSYGGAAPRVGTRVGDDVVDLAAVAWHLGSEHADVLAAPSLNALMALGPQRWREVRRWVRDLFEEESHRDLVLEAFRAADQVVMHLPIEVGDYVDFYASETHASNVGKLFRPNAPALPVNWKHLPIGYHGRSGTVVVSGSNVTRPSGQRRPGPDGIPAFGPSIRLDIECEVGFVVGTPSDRGEPVDVSSAREHIFGLVLLNDWSARDIQAWEYVPLGPFLGKSFATSISAWVLPLEALSAAEVALPKQSPPVLPYLGGSSSDIFALDLHLEIVVNGQVVSQPEYRDMYWSPAQMLAHMTVNGASLRVGDLFGSGTVSGAERHTFGSLLELSWNGAQPVALGSSGETRTFLEDGDTVTLRGWAPAANGERITLGEVTGHLLP